MAGPAASHDPLPRADLAREVAEAARAAAASGDYPAATVEQIRAAAAGLGAHAPEPGDIRHAALLLERQAVLDLEVPTGSRVPGVRLVKRAVKALVIWYLRFVGHQITAFGQATARFGLAVASRVDRLDAEVADLRARVERLERSGGDGEEAGTVGATGSG